MTIPHNKTSPEKAAQVIAAYASGLSIGEAAIKVGLCRTTASRIIRASGTTLRPRADQIRATMSRLLGSAEDCFLGRVTVNAMTGCWEWRGSRVSKARFFLREEGRYVVPTHFAIERFDSRRRIVPRNAYVLPKCGNQRCVLPAHLVIFTARRTAAKKIAAARAERGWVHPNTVRLAGENAPAAKLTWAQARAIRISDLPAAQLARKYGVSVSMIHRIKRGAAWKERWVMALLSRAVASKPQRHAAQESV